MRRASIVAVIAMLALAGCETPPVAEKDVDRTVIAFLQDGSTTRDDAVLALGAPSDRFENDRILTFFLRTDKEGTMLVGLPPRRSPPVYQYWRGYSYSLVLVFDERGVLEQHSLVRLGG